ncbi:MAG TPA: type II toxin-antitoxin system prevent-host-death family antitoxin [Patescibacteria group bacterium]|nr:type II toxin-antitoxin system prevent-host-death family antitoxin [Patescibacteria group bacterium]
MIPNTAFQYVIPVTDARKTLNVLVGKSKRRKQPYILTKRGKPQAVLMDIALWNDIEQRLSALYKKSYIDPKLLPYTRDFSDREIQEWLKNDQL